MCQLSGGTLEKSIEEETLCSWAVLLLFTRKLKRGLDL